MEWISVFKFGTSLRELQYHLVFNFRFARRKISFRCSIVLTWDLPPVTRMLMLGLFVISFVVVLNCSLANRLLRFLDYTVSSCCNSICRWCFFNVLVSEGCHTICYLFNWVVPKIKKAKCYYCNIYCTSFKCFFKIDAKQIKEHEFWSEMSLRFPTFL